MTAPRAAVYGLLVGDTTLSALGITAGTIFPTNTIDDAPRDTAFLVVRWEETTPRWGLSGSPGATDLTLWAHDHGGSYARINAILKRCKEILEPAAHVAGSDNQVLTQADWRGDSADLYDDGYRTLTRNSAWKIISREAA